MPLEELHQCQFCGYVLSKKEKHIKTIRNRLADIISALHIDQIFATKNLKLTDKGGSRSGTDRRKRFSINYFPEKRLGKDRRKGIDRRSQVANKRRSERRFSLKQGKPFSRKRKGLFRMQV